MFVDALGQVFNLICRGVRVKFFVKEQVDVVGDVAGLKVADVFHVFSGQTIRLDVRGLGFEAGPQQ